MLAKAASSRLAFIKRHPDILVLISVVGCGVTFGTYSMFHKLTTDQHLRLKPQHRH
ncbi:hypothetical protein CONCODRAFT_80544 [Conidiobolus coronatus NRRL 28638]|uniref:Uncharacterized protein n=1 Tax=Conidiobolus coronatus (strain ATCC 28846 / CBS 209.66 / NRRL 28638) TaxID=796925 RepID=A0A137NUA5_CONC2|nr:hypothetical protein CONCODRAFT_80544 [Conidiobolus coronatus NRRL 28638]|eukprot:KXN66251.1 hypothetical protein CONCODRAFT_80544 [Conidiobolus coronatus NRRL 28638]